MPQTHSVLMCPVGSVQRSRVVVRLFTIIIRFSNPHFLSLNTSVRWCTKGFCSVVKACEYQRTSPASALYSTSGHRSILLSACPGNSRLTSVIYFCFFCHIEDENNEVVHNYTFSDSKGSFFWEINSHLHYISKFPFKYFWKWSEDNLKLFVAIRINKSFTC